MEDLVLQGSQKNSWVNWEKFNWEIPKLQFQTHNMQDQNFKIKMPPKTEASIFIACS
jgi:hypothetical protein